MSSGLPFLKFFPDDYLSDERLCFCSLAAQGLWMRMLCFMHKNGRRGYLDGADGVPLSLEQLARFAGVSTELISPLIQELLTSGVASVTAQGTIFNRRMVREEALRETRAVAGQKGGVQTREKVWLKQKSKQKSSKPLDSFSSGLLFEEFSSGGENAPLEVVSARFVKPTLEEVKAYCTERNNKVDAEQFVAFYEARGWKVKGGDRMYSWKHAVITWEKYGKETEKNGPKIGKTNRLTPEELIAAMHRNLQEKRHHDERRI